MNMKEYSARKGVCLLMPLVLGVLLAGCGSGGGGGSSSGSGVTVSGSVLLVETNQPPSPGAAVNIGGQTGTTSPTGSFTLTTVPSGTTSGTISATGEQTLTLALKLTAGQINNLGTIYLSASGYTASVTGTVVSSGTLGQTSPVSGATVTIGGQSAVSAADGTFSIASLPVGLGADPTVPIGNVQAAGFVNKPVLTQFPLAAGSNPLGSIVLGAPIGSSTPGSPYTVYGFVKSGGSPVSTSVSITPTVGPLIAHTDPTTGEYYFWVPPGTYTVTELSKNVTQTVTLANTSTPVQAPDLNIP